MVWSLGSVSSSCSLTTGTPLSVLMVGLTVAIDIPPPILLPIHPLSSPTFLSLGTLPSYPPPVRFHTHPLTYTPTLTHRPLSHTYSLPNSSTLSPTLSFTLACLRIPFDEICFSLSLAWTHSLFSSEWHSCSYYFIVFIIRSLFESLFLSFCVTWLIDFWFQMFNWSIAVWIYVCSFTHSFSESGIT